VGPYVNPSETYNYYDLPFCQHNSMEVPKQSLGETLKGDELTRSLFDVRFKSERLSHRSAAAALRCRRAPLPPRSAASPIGCLGRAADVRMATLCELDFTAAEYQQLRHAIEDDYYFEFVTDKLPMWGFVGETKVEGGVDRPYLFTHLHFHFAYNGDQLIEATVSTDAKLETMLVDPAGGAGGGEGGHGGGGGGGGGAAEKPPGTKLATKPIGFTYSVTWTPTDVPYGKRMDKYSKASFLPMHLEIHWFSIINSFVTVILLTGFLATIMMRVLKNDFVKYEQDVEIGGGGAGGDDDESGWKMIHGDVFRFPPHVSLLCSILGVGAQLFALMVAFFLLGVVGVFYAGHRGHAHVAIIVLYALTACVSGYVSAAMFRKFQGDNWVHNVLQTAVLLALPFFIVFCFENTVAVYNGATTALPLSTIMFVAAVWSLVTFPLTVFGAITGRQRVGPTAEFEAPCRTAKVPREIPPYSSHFRKKAVQMMIAGFLPFSAIYIEIYYIFASVWGHKSYTVYSILLIVFVILLIVTSFVNIALTYFTLAAEDHQWWWRAVLNGGSTGIYIYAYCFYYWWFKAEMEGFLQASFFFGYMAVVCYAFFIMLGAVGFVSSLAFVRYIYSSVHAD
jgi:transmembrane 9 superfamily protein 1